MDTNLRQPFQMMQYEVKIGYMGLTSVLEGFEYVLKHKVLTESKREKQGFKLLTWNLKKNHVCSISLIGKPRLAFEVVSRPKQRKRV